MSAILTVTDHWTDGKRIHVIGNLKFSGNYITGGVTLNFSSDLIKSGAVPTFVSIIGQGGYGGYIEGTLYDYRYLPSPVPSPTIQTGLVKVATAGSEIAASGYPSGVVDDSIQVYAVFPKFVNDGPLPLF